MRFVSWNKSKTLCHQSVQNSSPIETVWFFEEDGQFQCPCLLGSERIFGHKTTFDQFTLPGNDYFNKIRHGTTQTFLLTFVVTVCFGNGWCATFAHKCNQTVSTTARPQFISLFIFEKKLKLFQMTLQVVFCRLHTTGLTHGLSCTNKFSTPHYVMYRLSLCHWLVFQYTQVCHIRSERTKFLQTSVYFRHHSIGTLLQRSRV